MRATYMQPSLLLCWNTYDLGKKLWVLLLYISNKKSIPVELAVQAHVINQRPSGIQKLDLPVFYVPIWTSFVSWAMTAVTFFFFKKKQQKETP